MNKMVRFPEESGQRKWHEKGLRDRSSKNVVRRLPSERLVVGGGGGRGVALGRL